MRRTESIKTKTQIKVGDSIYFPFCKTEYRVISKNKEGLKLESIKDPREKAESNWKTLMRSGLKVIEVSEDKRDEKVPAYFSVNTVAEELNLTPSALRKILRNSGITKGESGKYELTLEIINQVKTKLN